MLDVLPRRHSRPSRCRAPACALVYAQPSFRPKLLLRLFAASSRNAGLLAPMHSRPPALPATPPLRHSLMPRSQLHICRLHHAIYERLSFLRFLYFAIPRAFLFFCIPTSLITWIRRGTAATTPCRPPSCATRRRRDDAREATTMLPSLSSLLLVDDVPFRPYGHYRRSFRKGRRSGRPMISSHDQPCTFIPPTMIIFTVGALSRSFIARRPFKKLYSSASARACAARLPWRVRQAPMKVFHTLLASSARAQPRYWPACFLLNIFTPITMLNTLSKPLLAASKGCL